MVKQRLSRFLVTLLLFASGSLLAAEPEDEIVKIGVLSHRGDEATLRSWTKTANYLSANLPGYLFSIEPLDFTEVEAAVEQDEVDFVLVNPGIYVNLEVRHRVSRIATLNNRLNDVPYNVFGGVIFTRADRTDIQSLKDLTRNQLMAVDATSLGGFQMAWLELHRRGIDVHRDLEGLSFGGTHDKVVMTVLEGRVDVGTVRTDILERMALNGDIELDDFRIINAKDVDEFPFHLSTPLYPEWPFSKTRKTSNALAQQVAVALLNMPENHPAAIAGNYAGWTIPLDYQPVHDLFKELQLPPYHEHGPFTLTDVVNKYWLVLLLSSIFLLALMAMSIWVMHLNRQLEKAKSSLERQHKLILDSVADGIYGVDTNGNSTFVNRAMERITGWKAEEIIGRNQHEILHHTHADGSHYPGSECPVYHTFRDNTPRFIKDDIFWHKENLSIPVEYSSTPIKDENDEVIGAVVVFRDITERKKAEEEARQHQIELAHVTRLSTMGEMASGIAHEVNQPLAAIANYTRSCIRMLESDNSQKALLVEVMGKVAAQAERAGEIIRQLRRFVRKEEPQYEHVDLNEIVRKVAILVQPEIRKHNVLLKLALAEQSVRTLAYDIQIEQVILNLVMNAIEAMDEVDVGRRQLMIRTINSEAGCCLVEVEDTGPGMNEEMVEKVFDPFVTTKSSGMGIGLSISRGIIEGHDGSMEVESQQDKGTTFRFYMPGINEGEDD